MSFKVNIVRSDKTALQIASHQGFTAVVEFLLQLGALVNLQVSLIKFWPIIFNRPDWKNIKKRPWRWFRLGRELPHLDEHTKTYPCTLLRYSKPLSFIKWGKMPRIPVFHSFHQYRRMCSVIKILIELLAIYRTLKVTLLFITQHLGECSTKVTQCTSQSNATLNNNYVYLLNKQTRLQTCLACFVY